jgi:undecaprenyl-diphosphatase
MSILQAIILGIVQGLTEFIPISSTAHLVFASRLTDLYAGVERALRAEQITATIAVIQLGTLVAVFLYFWRDIYSITFSFTKDHLNYIKSRPGGFIESLSAESRLGWLIFIGSLPIGIVGLIFKDEIEGSFTKDLYVISTMMILIALLLIVAEYAGRRKKTINELSLSDALIVGFAQVLSLIPGASRSGSTIMGGLFAGQTRETAARFSFLLSIPAITASGLLELNEAIEKLPEGSFLPLAVATVVSGVVGYLSIWFLLLFLRKYSTGIFIGYRLVVGIVLMALLLSGKIAPQGM